MDGLVGVGRRFAALEKVLDERSRRLVVAAECKAWGPGGISAVSQATGVEEDGPAVVEATQGAAVDTQAEVAEADIPEAARAADRIPRKTGIGLSLRMMLPSSTKCWTNSRSSTPWIRAAFMPLV